MRARSQGLALVAAGCCLVGCSGPTVSSAAPPLEVCGQVISATAAGAVLTDASVRTRVAGIPTAGSAVFIRLAPHCADGATITFDPPGSAVVISSAKAQDGRLAAIGVCMRTDGVAHVVRVDGSTSAVDLRGSGVTC